MNAISFAENLKQSREAMRMSQADLARELGISYQTYNGYETKGNEPKYELLVKIAKALYVSTDELLGAELPIDDWYEIRSILKEYGFEVNIEEDTITLRIETTTSDDAEKNIGTFLTGTFKHCEIAELLNIFEKRLNVYRLPILADFLTDQLIPKMIEEVEHYPPLKLGAKENTF